jgi:molecular chaperone DnaJ
MSKDYYSILGLSRGASPEEIKKAYRKKALESHPDRNPGDAKAEAQFKLISEAYEVLGDENKRRIYDQYGEEALNGANMGGGFGGAGGFSSMEEALRTFMGAFGGRGGGSAESIFDFFGGGFGGEEESRGGPQKGASKKTTIRISFKEAATGVEKELSIQNYVKCNTCSGLGAKSRTGIKTCPTCQGRGQTVQNRGFFSMASTCHSCNGAGQVITDPCKDCRGAGRQKEKQIKKIRIPAGVDTGLRLKMAGMGDAGESGGPPGDLFVHIEVEPHPTFHRDGDDVYLELPITFPEAALGCTKEVPTPLGESIQAPIPEGVQSGYIVKIPRRGISNVHGQGQGDLLLKVVVETPVRLSAKQKQLLEEFMESETSHNHPKRKTFVDKIKSLFV